TGWLTLNVLPAPMLGVLMLASSGSLVVTLLLDAARRMFVVDAVPVLLHLLRSVKLTVAPAPAAPLPGVTARFWTTRSAGAPVTVNALFTRSLASLTVPCPSFLPMPATPRSTLFPYTTLFRSTGWLTLNVLPAPMLGVLMLASSGSLVVTLLLDAARR